MNIIYMGTLRDKRSSLHHVSTRPIFIYKRRHTTAYETNLDVLHLPFLNKIFDLNHVNKSLLTNATGPFPSIIIN